MRAILGGDRRLMSKVEENGKAKQERMWVLRILSGGANKDERKGAKTGRKKGNRRGQGQQRQQRGGNNKRPNKNKKEKFANKKSTNKKSNAAKSAAKNTKKMMKNNNHKVEPHAEEKKTAVAGTREGEILAGVVEAILYTTSKAGTLGALHEWLTPAHHECISKGRFLATGMVPDLYLQAILRGI